MARSSRSAAAARAAATPGTTYQISLLLKNDEAAGNATPTDVTLAFYDNNSTYGSRLAGSMTTPFSLVSNKVDAQGGGAFIPETFTASNT